MSYQADNQMLQVKAQPHPEYLLALQKLIDRSELLQRELQQQLPELLEDRSTETQYFDEYLSYLADTLHEVQQYSAIGEIRAKKRVAFGGAFSAGKSSLINALIGEKRLVVEIDPTTSIPTYVCAGEAERITALNLFQRSVGLAQAEFASLTHDEQVKHGTHVGGLLRTVVIQMPSFGWQHLALLDTPGYSKPTKEQSHERTDADIAYEQLNSADCIVWVVSAASGVISEDELEFLARLDADIPKLVVLNRADSKPAQDLADIQALVQCTLQQKNIAVVDVVIASARKPKDYPLTGLIAWLDEWDQPVQTATQSLAQFIKAVLGQLHEQVRYAHYEVQHVYQMQADKNTRFSQAALSRLIESARQQQILLADAEIKLKKIERDRVVAKIAEFVELAKEQFDLKEAVRWVEVLKNIDLFEHKFGLALMYRNANMTVKQVDQYFGNAERNFVSGEIEKNENIPWTVDLIDRYKEEWSWRSFSNNKSLPWSTDFMTKFRNYMDWDWLSESNCLPWSVSLIQEFSGKWDWEKLSQNESLPWSASLLETCKGRWDWQSLSKNESLPWSVGLIEAFIGKWDWEKLSQNESIPWSVRLIKSFNDKWDWQGLSGNESLPWSISFFERHEDKWDWRGLSWNRSLPWSVNFFEKYQDKWDWRGLSGNESLPWSISFFERHQDKWDWERLSCNKSLPWSVELIRKHQEKWDWEYGFSINTALPWSIDLIEEFSEKWDWNGCCGLSNNESLPWSIELIKKYQDEWDWLGLWGQGLPNNEGLPWSADFFDCFKSKWEFGLMGMGDFNAIRLPRFNADQVDEIMQHLAPEKVDMSSLIDKIDKIKSRFW